MAVYRITAPDGSVFDVTAPDDATEDQVMAYAQQQFAQQPKAEATPRSAEDPTLWAGGVVPSTDPTAGQSFLTNVHQGAGKFFADSGRGIGQMLGMVDQQEVDAARLRDEPLANTGGGMVGQGLGAAATTIAAAPVSGGAMIAGLAGRAAPYVGAAMGGGAIAGIQPVATGESRNGNAAMGAGLGVLGQGVASGLSALAGRAAQQLGPVVRQSIDSARAAGIPLNVSQVTNSGPIRALQAVTRYLPGSGAAGAAQKQQQAFNAAVGRSFGADNATVLSDDVMKAARERLSGEFNDIYSRNDVAVTPDVMRRLLAIEREAGENMVPEEAQIVRNQIERIVREAPDGQISGRMYQSLRTAIQGAEKKGGDLGRLIRGVRTELDDAAAQSVSAEDAARLAKVRSGWANLRTTEDALRQVAGSGGNVRPASLWPLIRKGSTREMRELAKIGQNVLKDQMGDSGTAQRMFWQQLATGGGAAGAGLGVGGLAALPVVAKGLLGGAVVGRAINSNAASRLLEQGKPLKGLARLAQPLPRLLPAAAAVPPATLDLGTVSGYDPNDPRYRGAY